MKPWLVAGLFAILALAPTLATAQQNAPEGREVFVRVEYRCFFEPPQSADSFPRTVRDPAPGRPGAYEFFFNPLCQGPLGEVTLHDAVSGATLNPSEPIFQPTTFFTIGAAGCAEPTCPGSLRVNVAVRNDGTADLELEVLNFLASERFVSVDGLSTVAAQVRNNGPEVAEEVSLRLSLPDGVRLIGRRRVRGVADCSSEFGGTVRCDLPDPLQSGDREAVFVSLTADAPGIDLRIAATVESAAPDHRPGNNRRATNLTVTGSPESTVQVTSNGATGTAKTFLDPPNEGPPVAEVLQASAARVAPRIRRLSRIRRVEIAVLRRTGPRGRCLWLANRRGRFRARAPLTKGECDRGRWLRAEGTARWRFTLARRWPKGRYTLYSRAVNRAGVRETGFSRREKNLVNFTVRR